MIRRRKLFSALFSAGLLCASSMAFAGDINIKNLDAGSGQGLDDPTPATPVGGNPGTTRGEQARIVFQFAANMWGAVLKSDVPVDIDVAFKKLECDSTSGVLGSTRALGIYSFNPGQAPAGALEQTWYHVALLNMFAGEDVDPSKSDIQIQFNGGLGTTGCLDGLGWYFGLDGKTPSGQSNLLNVMLHEMAHGLGFSAFNDLTTGKPASGSSGPLPDVYSLFVYDNAKGKKWYDLDDNGRKDSALNDGHLVLTGPNLKEQMPLVLTYPTLLRASAPAGAAGDYTFTQASFGPAATVSNFAPNSAVVVATGSNAEGCTTFDNAAAVSGHIAIIDRGTCGFAVKARLAEAAGATAVILANNQAGSIIPAGDDQGDPTIPVIAISQADGTKLKQNAAGLMIGMVQGDQIGGADADGNVMIYAPTTLNLGSSFSHFDTRLTPQALMNFQEVSGLQGQYDLDLTPAVFMDEGWKLNDTTQKLLTCDTGVPTWVPGGVVVGANVLASAKLKAGSAADVADYKTQMQDYASTLASDGVITSGQASSLNACLSDAELQNQFDAWGNAGNPGGDDAIELTKGVALGGQSGTAGSTKLYKLEVPANSRSLNLRTFGGSGNVSLYVKVGAAPTATDYGSKSVHAGNSESVVTALPAAGTYYLLVVGESAFSGVSVQGSFSAR